MSAIRGPRAIERTSAMAGHIVQTLGEELPYMVVLQYAGGAADTVHPVATIREGEALIRQRLPSPPPASKLREWNSL